MKRLALMLAMSCCLSACGAGDSSLRPTADVRDANTFYPLEEGNVWSYNIHTGEGLPTLGITRVIRRVGNQVEVSANGQQPQQYEIRPEGIFRVGKEAWLLRTPIEQGQSWPSSLGKTARIVAVGQTIETNAGTFQDCIQIDETGGPTGSEVSTSYCPEVGPVRIVSSLALEHSARSAQVEALLIGFELRPGSLP